MSETMTSKQRMLCALERGKPDRLPVTVHQWQRYHLDKYLDGISDIEAFEKLGLDAQIQYFPDMDIYWHFGTELTKFPSPQWDAQVKIVSDKWNDRVVHHSIRTPKGQLSYKMAGDGRTSWVTEYLVKHDEDIELIRKYMPAPPLDPTPTGPLYDKLGDRGILRGSVWGSQAGCWQNACVLMDMNDLILRCIDQPDWVHEFLGILLEKKLKYIESMKGAKFDLIEMGGGAGSSTVISPKIFEEFCLPYDRKMHDALHELGFKISYHTCGGTLGIEELLVATGSDASETLAPVSMGSNQEPWDFKAKVGDRLALIGGIDQYGTLIDGKPEQVREKVVELFEKVGQDGGYICAPSDHFFETELDNLKAFADTARECTY